MRLCIQISIDTLFIPYAPTPGFHSRYGFSQVLDFGFHSPLLQFPLEQWDSYKLRVFNTSSTALCRNCAMQDGQVKRSQMIELCQRRRN